MHWGPRTIDLDVLVWGRAGGANAGAGGAAPCGSPSGGSRCAPLVALVRFDTEVPGTGKSLAYFLAATVEQQLELVAQSW